MTKQVLSRALILVSALLVLNGCKSDTANDAKEARPGTRARRRRGAA